MIYYEGPGPLIPNSPARHKSLTAEKEDVPDIVIGAGISRSNIAWCAKGRDTDCANLAMPISQTDTVVALGDRILEKPADKEAAFEMLSALSGSTHKVHTGVVVVMQGKDGPSTNKFSEETTVCQLDEAALFCDHLHDHVLLVRR